MDGNAQLCICRAKIKINIRTTNFVVLPVLKLQIGRDEENDSSRGPLLDLHLLCIGQEDGLVDVWRSCLKEAWPDERLGA